MQLRSARSETRATRRATASDRWSSLRWNAFTVRPKYDYGHAKKRRCLTSMVGAATGRFPAGLG
jgi:hypothetical protein